jgi:AcrR family transcriptional regulator
MPLGRDDILGEACDLYLEAGMEGFSMRKLADRLGVTAPALYRHFDDREEVLTEVVGEGYRILRDTLYRALEEPTPADRFFRAGRAYLEFALAHPGLYQVLYASRDVLGLERLPEEASALACSIGQFWNDRVRECMDAGFLEEEDPQAVSRTLWAHGHGLISIYLLGMLDISEEEFRNLYRTSSVRVLAGVASEQARTELRDRVS